MSVGTYSLISLEAYKSYAGIGSSEIEVDAFSIYCSSSDATNATIKKSGDTLTLVITGGADAGTNAIDLTSASYDTLGELVTYINTISGWIANLEGWSSAPSTDIKVTAETHVLGSDDELTVKFYDNYILEKLIDRASTEIETFLHRNIKSRSYTHERYDGGEDEIYLKNYPVTALVQICDGELDMIQVKNTSGQFNAYVTVTTTGIVLTVDGSSVDEKTFASYATMATMATALNAESGWTASVIATAYNSYPSNQLFEHPNRYCLNEYADLCIPDDPLDGYDVDMTRGIVKLGSASGSGFQNVFISYTAGYSTVPYDLVLTCCRLVAYYDNLRERDESLQVEKEGDYSFHAFELEKALSPDQIKTLKAYRRPLV